ncbi:MAG: DUF3883 domain-containing protein [Syntrophomonas sp.]
MKSYSIDIIDIHSALPQYMVEYGDNYNVKELDLATDEVIIDKIINDNNDTEIDEQSKAQNKEDNIPKYVLDEDLGDIGEEYVLKRLEDQQGEDNKISKIERVSITQKKKSFGYDIEVKLANNVNIGIEVKSTRLRNGNVIHLTNNEIRAFYELNELSYLIIVVFDNKTDEVGAIYRIVDFIHSLRIDKESLSKVIGTDILNNIQFYPQVFVVNIPINVMGQFKLEINENII